MAFLVFFLVFFKSVSYPSFGMTTAKAIRDLFASTPVNTYVCAEHVGIYINGTGKSAPNVGLKLE